MNEAQKKLVARKYLDKQLETMKRLTSLFGFSVAVAFGW